MTFELPKLPYAYDALEPHIDEETLKIHHGKHHQTYLDKFNAGLTEENITEKDMIQIFSKVSTYKPVIRNAGGGYWNHTFYWESMAPTCNGPEENKEIAEAINNTFGSFEKFKEVFTTKATTLFGSGWTWLILNKEGTLEITNTQNQDNPHMDLTEKKGIPLLVIDVWEHAYYLKYQNKRPEYIEHFFNIINWDKVNERYKTATETK